jgi:hypothetical protein
MISVPLEPSSSVYSTACRFGETAARALGHFDAGAGLEYQVVFLALTRAEVESAEQHERGDMFRSGFARDGIAVYTRASIGSPPGDDDALALWFDGSHGRGWEIAIAASPTLRLTQAAFVSVMTRLRDLSGW